MMTTKELLARRPLRLELGCGTAKRMPDAVGVDILDLPGVDVVGDAIEVLRSLPSGSVDGIYSEHFMEHLEDPLALLQESARVLRKGGEFRAVVPHFSNPAFYSDPTHRTFFGLYTFSYWIETTSFRRQVPHYAKPLPFELVRAHHIFKSSRPFYVRHALKKFFSSWVNLGRWTQEFYEEHFCWVMPCYEMDFLLTRK